MNVQQLSIAAVNDEHNIGTFHIIRSLFMVSSQLSPLDDDEIKLYYIMMHRLVFLSSFLEICFYSIFYQNKHTHTHQDPWLQKNQVSHISGSSLFQSFMSTLVINVASLTPQQYKKPSLVLFPAAHHVLTHSNYLDSELQIVCCRLFYMIQVESEQLFPSNQRSTHKCISCDGILLYLKSFRVIELN